MQIYKQYNGKQSLNNILVINQWKVYIIHTHLKQIEWVDFKNVYENKHITYGYSGFVFSKPSDFFIINWDDIGVIAQYGEKQNEYVKELPDTLELPYSLNIYLLEHYKDFEITELKLVEDEVPSQGQISELQALQIETQTLRQKIKEVESLNEKLVGEMMMFLSEAMNR